MIMFFLSLSLSLVNFVLAKSTAGLWKFNPNSGALNKITATGLPDTGADFKDVFFIASEDSLLYAEKGSKIGKLESGLTGEHIAPII